MQQDFYGDGSVQQLIADDSDQVPEGNNIYTESLLEDLDEHSSLIDSCNQLQHLLEQKTRPEATPGNPPTKENAQDQPKKNSKILQKKLNIAEKKLA